MPDRAAARGTGSGRRGVCYRAWDHRYVLDIPGVARYCVERGSRIAIEPTGSDASGVRAFLMGPVLGAVLLQRRLLAFCGSAVRTPRGAIVLIGLSASGKSTAAALLVQRGYPLISDGLIAAADVQGHFAALPGLSRLQLWADVLTHLGIPEREVEAWRTGLRKYAVPVGQYCPEPVSLAAIYALVTTNSAKPSIEDIRGFDKCAVLALGTHSQRFVGGMDPCGTCFREVVRLAAAVPVKRLNRSGEAGNYDEVADLLERDFLQ